MRAANIFAASGPKGREGGVLKKLRRRLVAIIRLLVGGIMIALIAFSSANAQESFTELVNRSLERVLSEPGDSRPGDSGDETLGMQHLPVLWVDVSSDGVWLGTNQSQFSVDADALRACVNDAISSSASEGRLTDDHLTWKTISYAYGWRIAIADTSSIDAARNAQIVGDLELAIAGLVALFLIANLLARWLLGPVERAWEQQHQFVADASHELKTPLAVILANTQILKESSEELPEESRRWVKSTADEAERMKGLVEGLLELARTEEGAGNARRDEDVDLSGITEGEALQFDAVAFEQGCSIEASVAEDLHVKGDPDQLERLVKTLLDNACKYAESGTEVLVSLERQGQAAELSVTNHGAPIDPEDLPHIFDRFYRSDKARARETGGFGLGLAIAKGIVESHGGKISVTSSLEAGTRFVVRLPLMGRS